MPGIAKMPGKAAWKSGKRIRSIQCLGARSPIVYNSPTILWRESPLIAARIFRRATGILSGAGVMVARQFYGAVLLLMVLAARAAAGTVVYVDDDALPGGDGSTWATALRHLQDAVSVSGGAEVRIAGGVYRTEADGTLGAGDLPYSFVFASGTVLRGGYAGLSSADPDDRDYAAHETLILGMYYLSQSPPASVIRAVIPNTVLSLEGLTITAGMGGGSYDMQFPVPQWFGGAGLICRRANLTATGCTFKLNYLGSGVGGAVLCSGGQAVFANCTFRQNGNQLGSGGAVALVSGANAVMRGCTFVDNGTEVGGAVFVALDSSLVLEDTVFEGNGVSGVGGAVGSVGNLTARRVRFCNNVGEEGGGGARISGTAVFVDCLFSGCRGLDYGEGGAIMFSGGNLKAFGCRFIGNQSIDGGAVAITGGSATFANCLFVSNGAVEQGAAIHLTGTGSYSVINSTISQNRCESITGAALHSAGTALIVNSILYENSNGAGFGMEAQLSTLPASVVHHCCIQGLPGGSGNGNIGADPRFNFPLGIDGVPDTSDDDFSLRAGSPAIDAGSNVALPLDSADLDGDGDTTELLPIDYAGSPRRADDPAIPDTGEGASPVVDMGAVERTNVTGGACCTAHSMGMPVCMETSDAASCLSQRFVCNAVTNELPTCCGPCGTTCFGDVDGNGVVTPGDRGFIAANIGQTAYALLCQYDLDGNGFINAGDRGFVAANIGLCSPLPNYQNGSGLNAAGDEPDGRFAAPVFGGAGMSCDAVGCP